MASSNVGCAVFPSGIEIPSRGAEKGSRVEAEAIQSFRALLEMLNGAESKGLDGTFEMRAAADAFSVLREFGCTPAEFFNHNLQHNKNISPVTRRFLIETISMLNGGRRTISASLFSELMEMPNDQSSKMAKHNSDVKSVTIPTFTNRDMIVTWLSKDGGLTDMLWSFRAMFG